MAHRIDRILSSLIEFLARTWPISKTREQVIGDYQRVWSKTDRTPKTEHPD
jgi:transposase